MEATHVEAFVVVFRYRGASPLASTNRKLSNMLFYLFYCSCSRI